MRHTCTSLCRSDYMGRCLQHECREHHVNHSLISENGAVWIIADDRLATAHCHSSHWNTSVSRHLTLYGLHSYVPVRLSLYTFSEYLLLCMINMFCYENYLFIDMIIIFNLMITSSLCHRYLSWNPLYWRRRGVPGPFEYPFIGYIPYFIKIVSIMPTLRQLEGNKDLMLPADYCSRGR